MSERERLIKLIDDFGDDVALCDICNRPREDCEGCTNEQLAEYLVENGVIVLPVKVGQTVYVIPKYDGKPYCGVQMDKVQMVGITSRGIHIKTRNKSNFNKTYMLGKTVFLTKEEAEKALKGGAE